MAKLQQQHGLVGVDEEGGVEEGEYDSRPLELPEAGVVGLASHQPAAAGLWAAGRFDDQRAIPAINLEPDTGAVPGYAAHVGRDHRPTFQDAAHEHIVRRGDVYHAVSVGLAPLRDSSSDDR